MTLLAPHERATVRLWGASVLDPGPAQLYVPPAGRHLDPPWVVTTEIMRRPPTGEWPEHSHLEHELLWSPTGDVTVEAAGQVWLVPPALGIWLPAGVRHRARARVGSHTYVTYVAADGPGLDWDTSVVTGVSVSAALREVLLHNRSALMTTEQRLRLQRTALDLMVPVRTASLDVPMPRSPDLRGVADAIVASPSDDRTVAAWAATLNVSGRTLMRRFEAETGLSLTRWRILVRVRTALLELAAGRSVVNVARRLGYTNPSAFIRVFRGVIGQTPAAYARSTTEAAPAFHV